MAFNPHFYEILGIDKEASQQVIEHVYKNLQRAYHPDFHPENRAFYTEKIKAINEAYEMLANPSKREEYDRLLFAHQNSTKSKNMNSDYVNDFPRSIVHCGECGTELDPLELVCPQCGTSMNNGYWVEQISHNEHFLSIIRYERIKEEGIKIARKSADALGTSISRIVRLASR